MDRVRIVQGQRVPAFLYGTAWKEEATEGLVLAALAAGFRGIDTANQRKHYFEEGVGRAIATFFAEGHAQRDDLFLQTKFTFQRGQDQRLPYNPASPIATQVEQSFRSSLVHLGVEGLDSLLLHGPTLRRGLTAADREAWQAMEALKHAGGTRLLGVSNVSGEQLKALLDIARVAPAFVQNRCYASQAWDADVRTLCDANGIVYQGFSLLTANRDALRKPIVASIAAAHGISKEQLVFRFSMALGMLPLTGTTDASHMKLDLDAHDVPLLMNEIHLLEKLEISKK